MPSTITHAYLAIDIYNKLDRKVRNKINLENYKTYSQGFDIFFFSSKNNIRKLGSRAHKEKTGEYLLNLVKNVKLTKNDNQFNYLVGHISHYVADSTIHPYIHYLENKDTNKKYTKRDIHFIYETYIDNYYINKNNKNNNLKVHEFSFNTTYNKDVVDLLNKAYLETFNIDNMGYEYFKSLKNMKLFYHVFRYDKYGIKRVFYKIVNPVSHILFRDVVYLSYNFKLDKDYILNLDNNIWYNVKNKKITSNKSVLELYDDIVTKTINIINNLYDYIYLDKDIDISKVIGNLSYSTGLELKSK